MVGVRVDTGSLVAHGAKASGTDGVPAATVATPAGADPTSVAAVAHVNASAAALSAVLAHAGAVRQIGGTSIVGTAGMFEAQDTANSTAIRAWLAKRRRKRQA